MREFLDDRLAGGATLHLDFRLGTVIHYVETVFNIETRVYGPGIGESPSRWTPPFLLAPVSGWLESYNRVLDQLRGYDADELHRISRDTGHCFIYCVKYPLPPINRALLPTLWDRIGADDDA